MSPVASRCALLLVFESAPPPVPKLPIIVCPTYDEVPLLPLYDVTDLECWSLIPVAHQWKIKKVLELKYV